MSGLRNHSEVRSPLEGSAEAITAPGSGREAVALLLEARGDVKQGMQSRNGWNSPREPAEDKMQLRWVRIRKFTEEVGVAGAAAREGWEMTGD